jgi:flavin reductase (DIM6/NTAB) family NADH-FMN oxidoreductase RutF
MVTSKLGDRENAMPASWNIPVSFDPDLIAVNISPDRFSHDMIKESGKFGLNLLAADQVGLSRYAGSCSGRDTDKFKEIPHFYGELGMPLVKDCTASLECEVVDEVKEGDHTVFTGKVIKSYTAGKDPLLLFRGEYFRLGESLGGY